MNFLDFRYCYSPLVICFELHYREIIHRVIEECLIIYLYEKVDNHLPVQTILIGYIIYFTVIGEYR